MSSSSACGKKIELKQIPSVLSKAPWMYFKNAETAHSALQNYLQKQVG